MIFTCFLFHYLQSFHDILLQFLKWLPTAIINDQSLDIGTCVLKKLLNFKFSIPKYFADFPFVEQNLLRMVLATVARKIEMQKYVLGEIVAKTFCNEVLLHSLCLSVSHEHKLMFAI